MATWILVPCLGQLRTELNRIAPGRDTSSDGTIGDVAHQSRSSDHNDDEVGNVPIRDADSKHEVHAVDLDADLRESDLTMEKVVQHVVARCRSGAEKRLRYVIYNRRIWEASNNWRQRSYSGDNAHTQHAHFSSSYETRYEASTASWHLEDIPVALTEADKKWLAAQIDKAATTAAERVWKTKWNINFEPGSTPYMAEAGNILAHVPGEHARGEALLNEIKTDVEKLLAE
ncbi:hypothetical protein Aca07nite_18730 [Actinoplanes capillaceus]|uniref:Uncharacterized protein n=1 Tax=Actinoplanes campanulatus TaxID=113559 RepID=A0ABQ3WGH1_9ACTN|nr:hypothetical protein [Actinoplanes capillaceus]GID44598.1 hypothetical protein Aca07nite_18730 [Actinoplanes capillaceus]